jgi:hypothetical protein
VSEVGPAPTPYEKFISLESEEKVAALRQYYSHGTLIPLNQKEFNTVLRKFNAYALKRSREEEDDERPVTRSQKAKTSSKKPRKASKKHRKAQVEEADVLEDDV